MFSHYEQRETNFACVQTDLFVAGVGIGQLSAAAVACSSSVVDMVDTAVFTVRLAFRTGAIVSAISQQLDAQEVSDEGWSLIISGAADEIQTELQTVQDQLVGIDTRSLSLINRTKSKPDCSKIYESLYQHHWPQYMRRKRPAF